VDVAEQAPRGLQRLRGLSAALVLLDQNRRTSQVSRGVPADVGGQRDRRFMTSRPITIDDILTHFFASYLDGKTGTVRHRIEDGERQLRACIETEAQRILENDTLLMLAAERQFDPQRAVARVANADDLVFFLEVFVGPQWRPSNEFQRAAQTELTATLLHFVTSRRLVDSHQLACPILEVEAGIARERAERKLRRERHVRTGLHG
jgi:hypothetical protein